MRYNWEEFAINSYSAEPRVEYRLSIAYNDGTPCYSGLKAKISRETKYIGYTWKYLREQGLDPKAKTWQGEVGGTNLMAEYRSSGWDSFFRIKDDDLDTVFYETEAYLDELIAGGNVPQEWIDENVWD